ncbi:MAG: GH116 family glycosyl hydrolase [Bacteroidota bacterium]
MQRTSMFRQERLSAANRKNNRWVRFGTYLFFLAVIVIISVGYYLLTATSTIKVGVVGKESESSKLAYDWLNKQPMFEPAYISDQQINIGLLSDMDVLWLHREDSGELILDRNNIELLKDYVNNGGKLLLSQEAAMLITELGLEETPPTVNYLMAEDGGYGRKMGVHAFLEHPVFKGLHGGAFIFGPMRDVNCRQIGYFGENIPEYGKTLAVDWAYIQLKEQSRLMLEFDTEEGKVISIGSYMLLGMENQQQPYMNKFITNTLNYLVSENVSEGQYWNYDKNEVRPEKQISFGNSTAQENWEVPDISRLPEIYSLTGGDNYMEVSGKRMLVMGAEKGGIEEIWAHPFMALRDYEVGLSFGEDDSIYWLSDQEPEIWSYPGVFLRQYKFRRAYLKEWITVSPDKPQVVIRYEYRGVYPAKFYQKFKSNLRRMWPYSEKTTGDIQYSWDIKSNSFIVSNELDDMVSILGSSKDPEWISIRNGNDEKDKSWLYGDSTDIFWGFCGAATYPLEMNEDFYFVISATSEGMMKAVTDYGDAMDNPKEVFKQSIDYIERLQDNFTMLKSPDSIFNEAYKWTVLSTDKFLVETPGLGTALVAGYASSAHGWDGAQKVSGRPGYAWYFGRDGQWSAMSLLDYGDFENVRKQLDFYLKFQGVDGKIFHEVSTSGVVHYDASDATPLFVALAGKYLRHSGDVEFIRQNWQGIKEAMDFCYSTDVNNDNLIENVNVGHGWVEGGHLYGSQTTLYLASCWAEALEEAAYMAGAINETELEKEYTNDALAVRNIINNDFWNDETLFFNHGKYPDNTYNPELTVMPAIPIYFGQIDETKVSPVLNQFAGNGFTSDWGVRIVPESSKSFNPHGYHTGSVWPLYTGWTALAEYEGGNYLQGFQHIMNNYNVYKYWGRGYIEEVLNGLTYRPSGVCRHQCWSGTLALQPTLEGMIGFRPDALSNTVELSPAFPPHWDSFEVNNLRIGDQKISMDINRERGKTVYDFILRGGNEVNIVFNPVFPPGTEITKVFWQGREIDYELSNGAGGFVELVLDFKLTGDNNLEIHYSGGISIVPIIPDPKPNQTSGGFRLLGYNLTDNRYVIDFEGRAGSTETFEVYCPDWIISKVEGAELLNKEGDIYSYRLLFEGEDGYQNQSVRFQIDK